MKIIKAKKDFKIKEKYFFKNDEVNIKDINIIKKLNEKGFIEPLSFKDLINIEKEINKEEKLNGED